MSRLRFQKAGYCRCTSRPVFRLDLELLPPRARQRIELGVPRVLCLAPLAVEPTCPLESLQRGEQRTGIHLEDAARNLLDPSRDPEAVERLQAQRLEDQHVQRPLDDVGILLLHAPLRMWVIGRLRLYILIVKMWSSRSRWSDAHRMSSERHADRDSPTPRT